MPATESEQVDITRLILEIREERAAQKAKEKSESWTKYVSLLVVFFAVATGIGSLRAGSHSSRTVLRQAQASDQWAYYQAKGIKGRIAELEQHLATDEAKAKKLEGDVAPTSWSRPRRATAPSASRASATKRPGTAARSATASPRCRSPSRWARSASSPRRSCSSAPRPCSGSAAWRW